jgi:hypothetical protein
MSEIARATDKETSHIAANSIKGHLGRLQNLFLTSLIKCEEQARLYGRIRQDGFTAHEILEHVSVELRESVRKRIHELVRQNRICEVAKRHCRISKNLCTTYRTVSKQ